MAEQTASALIKSDPELKKISTAFAKVPAEADIEKTVKALSARGFNVIVVKDRKEALEATKKLIPKDASIHNGHSTTLEEIGFIDYLKTQTEWKNLHGVLLAEKDPSKQAKLRKEAHFADYFLCSPSAITHAGELVAADLTGTKTGPLIYDAGKVVFVTGANKIVPSFTDAIARTENYALALESARARLVYKVPGSKVGNLVVIKEVNPYGAPQRINVVLVKESLGY